MSSNPLIRVAIRDLHEKVKSHAKVLAEADEKFAGFMDADEGHSDRVDGDPGIDRSDCQIVQHPETDLESFEKRPPSDWFERWAREIMETVQLVRPFDSQIANELELFAKQAHLDAEEWVAPGIGSPRFEIDELDRYLSDLMRMPKASPRSTSGRKATINQRMLETMQKNTEASGWNSSQWAKYLQCAPSTVVNTETWRMLRELRLKQKAERMNDRHRKPKASDSRRD